MSVYTPTAVVLGDITIPGDGESIEAADVNVPLEAIADGVLYERSKLTPLATLATLTAIAAPADGTIRHVLGQGFYVFKTSATTGLSPFRLAADDLTAGGWLSSTAHETTQTRYVPASRITGATASAVAPSISAPFARISDAKAALDGMGSVIVAVASTDLTNAYGFFMPVDEFLVHGAVLSSASLRYTPDDASAPTVMLQYALVRSDRTGINSTASNLNSGGFTIDSGGSYAIGTDRNVALTTDQNNTIDLATYAYGVVIFDEHGTSGSAGNTIHYVSLTMTSIPDARR